MEISPCKFCGAEGKLEYEFTTDYYKSRYKDNYVVRCTTPNCFASKIHWAAYKTQEEAIEAWNRIPAVEPAQSGWLRAIDEALVCHDVGVVNADDTYEQAKDKLSKLLCVVQDIGAYFAEQEPAQAVPVAWLDEEFMQAYTIAELADADGTGFKPLYTHRAALDADTKRMMLELCKSVQEHVAVWKYPYGKQVLALAKQIRERLEAGNV